MTQSILNEIRARLAPMNRKILDHPYVTEAERGVLPLGKIKEFAAAQYYTVSHDVRSLALMASRAKHDDELSFFDAVYKGDSIALPKIAKMGEELGLNPSDLKAYSPKPETLTYAHYLTALAHFSSPGEQILAMTVNLPVWGSNCVRLGKALKEKYRIKETSFLDVFTHSNEEGETAVEKIISRYAADMNNLREVARLIQTYELMFWDGIYRE